MKTKLILNCLLFVFLSTNAKAQVKIFSGGNITVGNTITPASGFKMHLYGNCLFSDTSFRETSGHSAAKIRGLGTYSIPDAPDYSWWGDDNTGIFHPTSNFIGFTIGGTESMRITNRNNLLVGCTYDGGFRVSIDGQEGNSALATYTNFSNDFQYAHISYVNNKTTKNWAVLYNETDEFYVLGSGDVWAYNYNSLSDSTLKENINVLHNSRSKVLQLRGVSYNIKPPVLSNQLDSTTIISTSRPKTQIGLIAQEVERFVPEVVETNDKGLKAIAYPNLIALLIEAFKEENLIIDSLKTQISECCASGSGSFRIRSNNNSDASQNKFSAARLDQNKPNPFNSETKISFFIPENSINKALIVFDMQGTLIKKYPILNNGESYLNIPGGEYKAGMYLYTLLIDGKEIDTKRMILIN